MSILDLAPDPDDGSEIPLTFSVVYTYDSPSRAGPYRGRMSVCSRRVKGDTIFAPFGRATVVSCSRIRVAQ